MARMIVEMIARQIGVGAGRNAHAVQPMLIETVRRRFHRQMRHALVGQLIERAMQLDRIGRGQRAVGLALRRHDADGAEARRLQAERATRSARVKAATEVLPLVPVTAAIIAG